MRKLCSFVIVIMVLCASAVGAETLTWGPSPSTDVVGYKVYRSTVSGQYGAPLATIGNVLTYTITLPVLAVDTRYYMTVTAYDAAGNESPRSNEVEKMIIAAVAAPPQPVLVISNVQQTSLVVSWVGTEKIDIRYGISPMGWGSASVAICASSPCTITGLIPDTLYNIQAIHYRGVLNTSVVFGPFTSVMDVRTLKIVVPPSAPSNLQISGLTLDKVTIVANVGKCVSLTTKYVSKFKRDVICNH